MIKVRRKLYFVRRDHGRQVISDAAPHVAAAEPGRIPRVSRLMALAIHFDRLIRQGKVRDQSELARIAHVTQPRMTQIMNLLHLAPDIQEELLHLLPVVEGRDTVTERDLRPITQVLDWREQRRYWVQCRQTRREKQRTNISYQPPVPACLPLEVAVRVSLDETRPTSQETLRWC